MFNQSILGINMLSVAGLCGPQMVIGRCLAGWMQIIIFGSPNERSLLMAADNNLKVFENNLIYSRMA